MKESSWILYSENARVATDAEKVPEEPQQEEKNTEKNLMSRCRCSITLCRTVNRSFSVKHHTRSIGLSQIKVIFFLYMQANSEY